MPNVKLKPCKHGEPVTMRRTDGHWIIANDCCESCIDWNWSRLARAWNAKPALPRTPHSEERPNE